MEITRQARHTAAGLGLVVVIDVGSKLTAATVAAGHTTGPLVPVRNHELSLGIASAPPVTTVVLASIGILVAAAFSVPRALRGEVRPWVPACLIGGALANLLDRIAFGSVHDFLATPWFVFNFADVAVVTGLIGLLAARRHQLQEEVIQ